MTTSDEWFLTQNAPALIQWSGEADHVSYLGLRRPSPQCSVAADIGFDPLQNTAAFRFRVPISLKNVAHKKVPLYIMILPDKIQSVARRAADTAEPEVVTAFLSGTEQCSSAADILSIQFHLAQPPTIVGPASLTDFYPAKKGFGKILDALRSLSNATALTVHICSEQETDARVDALRDAVTAGTLRPSTKGHALNMLYGGSGGTDVRSLLANSSESPPSYDELGASPSSDPRLEGFRTVTGKRPLSSGGSSPQPKRRDARAGDVAAETQSWQSRLLGLELQVSALRNRVAMQEAAGSLTEDASVVDHLGRLDEDVRQLRAQMDRIEALLQQNAAAAASSSNSSSTASSEPETRESEGSFMTRVMEAVEDRLYEVRETEETIDEMMDDKMLDWKSEFKEWLEDQIREEIPRHVHEEVRESVPDILSRISFRPQFPRGFS